MLHNLVTLCLLKDSVVIERRLPQLFHCQMISFYARLEAAD